MPVRVWASLARVSMPRELPRCAAWSRRSGTTAHSLRRNLPLALSRPNSIELGVLVDHIEAHLDTDRREVQDGVALDDFIGPPIARPRVEIDQALVLLDDRVLPDRWRREIVKFLAAANLTLGAWRDHFDNHDRVGEMIFPVAYRAADHRNIWIANGMDGYYLHIATERTTTRPAQGVPQGKGKVHRDRDMGSRSPRHHRDDTACVLVPLGLIALPGQELVQRHQLFGDVRHGERLLLCPAVVQIRIFREASQRSGDCGDALDDGGPRRRDLALIEGDHREPCKRFK